jgi:hypothetical protein
MPFPGNVFSSTVCNPSVGSVACRTALDTLRKQFLSLRYVYFPGTQGTFAAGLPRIFVFGIALVHHHLVILIGHIRSLRHG